MDDPAVHPNDPCAPGIHGAVWRLNITVAGTPLTVPIYVDAITAGPEATFASAKIQLCLAGPIGTPAGAQLLARLLRRERRLHESVQHDGPSLEGAVHALHAGHPEPEPGGTTEGQALVPGRVSADGEEPEEGRIVISGRLLVYGQPFRGGG